ncbi:hypothetical protein ACEWY4_024340 [Coilia grayii]|uniref:Phosphoprotein membrane anchor with glycosphingolipid microdomains 1 n=1 Tax=Coilia grayii TaxID=363190 RepID=A0ABD1J0E4_9TELE
MAPALRVVLGAELAGSGVIVLANGQLALVGILTAVSAFLLLSLLLMLCASCQGQKKTNGHPGDHETLMNGQVSEKEVCSQSVESQGTDLAASSSHNGPLTSGTVLSDTLDTSPHPSEEMLSSQSELRSSKCPQDRELPSIPAVAAGGGGVVGVGGPPSLNGPILTSDPQPASGDGTYEMVCEGGVGGGVASRDASVEDSLYETVKGDMGALLANGILSPDDEDPIRRVSSYQDPPPLLNGHLTPTSSPPTPERGPLVAGVEYASIDLNKKSRYSADMEARRRSPPATTPDPRKQKGAQEEEEEEEEEEKPPPIPDKVLDENDNQHTISHMMMPHNGQLPSPAGSTVSEGRVTLENELYSCVVRPMLEAEGDCEEDKEGDYSSIGDLRGLGTHESVTNDLYASVKDIYATPSDPHSDPCDPHADPCDPLADPGYETIRIPKSAELRDSQSEAIVPVEPDYESVGELGLSRDMSRL